MEIQIDKGLLVVNQVQTTIDYCNVVERNEKIENDKTYKRVSQYNTLDASTNTYWYDEYGSLLSNEKQQTLEKMYLGRKRITM